MLAGKKVVVVGGSSGIGLATAELAKREGADVIVASRNVARLDAVADKLNAIAIPADVTSDDSVANLFRSCGPVDHVVVTAAQFRDRQRNQWRAGITRACAGAGTGAGPRQCGFSRRDRHADPHRHAGG